jgi:hypothetical protein
MEGSAKGGEEEEEEDVTNEKEIGVEEAVGKEGGGRRGGEEAGGRWRYWDEDEDDDVDDENGLQSKEILTYYIFKDVLPKDIKSQLLSLIVMAELHPRDIWAEAHSVSGDIRGMDPLGFGDQAWIKRGQEQA